MIDDTIKEPLLKLFGRVPFNKSDLDFSSLENLRTSLRGSGVDIILAELVKGTIPERQGVLGGIVLESNSTIRPFLVSDRGLLDISDDAQGTLLQADAMDAYAKAWLLVEKKGGFAHAIALYDEV